MENRQSFAASESARVLKNVGGPDDQIPQYVMEVHDLGLLVFSDGMDADSIGGIAKIAKVIDPSWEFMDPGIARAYGALFAVTSSENMERWKRIVLRRAERISQSKGIDAWLNGPDTGLSSVQIVYMLTFNPIAKRYLRDWGNNNYPYDPDDLGRCIRLLDQFPALMERFDNMRTLSKQWNALVDNWDELVGTYREEMEEHAREIKQGRSFNMNRTYDLMRKLLD